MPVASRCAIAAAVGVLPHGFSQCAGPFVGLRGVVGFDDGSAGFHQDGRRGDRRARSADAATVRDQCRGVHRHASSARRNPAHLTQRRHHRCLAVRFAEQRGRQRWRRRGRHRNARSRPIRVAWVSTRANGELLTTVEVGALPDMLTFTPDGNYLLVANEGEPSGYGAGFVDPEGSVSIIRMPSSLEPGQEAQGLRRAHREFHALQRPGSGAARRGHSHLRPGRERRDGLRARVHRRLGRFAQGLRDAAGEQRGRGDRHRELPT